MKQRTVLCWIFLSVLAFCSSANSQTTQTVLARAAKAFSPAKPVNGVTLNATGQWTAGSDIETGTATLIAAADGSFSVQLQLDKSSRTEAQTSFSSGQSCIWAGKDGVAHAAAAHNCMGSVAWFLPAVALFGNQQPSAVSTALVSSTAGGRYLDLRQQRTPSATSSGDIGALLARIGTSDLYLDPETYLPAAMSFNIHPDQNCGSDIPVEVIFTNYTTVNGISLPFRIQRYINGSLNLDLTVTQASTN